MEMTQIRYFLEVAESQHMTASAEKLHIAQPALSQAIKRFERELGVPLFEAKGRNIVLTEYGKYLREQLLPIAERLDSIPEQLKTMAKLRGETIHLNVLAASTLVTSAIIDYKSLNEGVSFQLLQNSQSDVFDIEISTKLLYRGEPARSADRFVCNEKIFLAVPANGRYSSVSSVTLKEVESEGFISLMGSRQFRYICDRFCRTAGIAPKIIFESDNPTAVKNMIAANLGVGFWPEFSWGKLDNDSVKLLTIAEPECNRDLVLTCRRNKRDNKTVEMFFEYLKDYFRRIGAEVIS